MLKLILQAVLLAGGIALGMSKLDSGAMQRIKDAVRELASGVGLGQYPPARPEPSTIPIGGAAKESAAPEQRRAEQNPIPPKPSITRLPKSAIGKRSSIRRMERCGARFPSAP